MPEGIRRAIGREIELEDGVTDDPSDVTSLPPGVSSHVASRPSCFLKRVPPKDL